MLVAENVLGGFYEPPNALGNPPSGASKIPLQTRAYAASRRRHTHERSEVGFTQMLGSPQLVVTFDSHKTYPEVNIE